MKKYIATIKLAYVFGLSVFAAIMVYGNIIPIVKAEVPDGTDPIPVTAVPEIPPVTNTFTCNNGNTGYYDANGDLVAVVSPDGTVTSAADAVANSGWNSHNEAVNLTAQGGSGDSSYGGSYWTGDEPALSSAFVDTLEEVVDYLNASSGSDSGDRYDHGFRDDVQLNGDCYHCDD